MSDVTKLLDDLSAGKTTIAAVAEDFAKRKWTKGKPAGNLKEAIANWNPDPGGGVVQGSWDEVLRAYHLGVINDQQYAALYEAVK